MSNDDKNGLESPGKTVVSPKGAGAQDVTRIPASRRERADSTRRLATTDRFVPPAGSEPLVSPGPGNSVDSPELEDSKRTIMPSSRTPVPSNLVGQRSGRTGPRGGTLMANLGSTQVPRPVELRAVTGQHEISSELRRVEGRYEVGQELGRGGMGVVRLVKDLDIGRSVAMKTLVPDDPDTEQLMPALIKEAQATGQLQHPNIIPVYELGVLNNNEIFYTMKAVGGLSLKDVLSKLRAGDPKVTAEYTERRLLAIFGQICQAMHYAHSKGVVHRDLKPDNVLLGEYGEVLVMDWGIAYVIGKDEGGPLASPGVVVGTPHYMAPEQARGEIDRVNGRSDIFSLGVMLYEILTLTTPITESDTELVLATLRKHNGGWRPESADPERPVPEPLAELVEIATSANPEDRYANARTVFDLVQAYLEGSAELERRANMAADELAIGVQALGIYFELRRTRQRLAARIDEREKEVYRWDSNAVKRELWELNARYGHMELVVSQAFSDAVNHFHRVLGLVPDQPQARAALTNLYWTRFEQAEETGDYSDMIYFGNLVLRYNDPDRGGPLAHGDGRITVRSFPEGAELVLFDFTQGVPDTQLANGRSLGAAPVSNVELPMGNYLMVAHKDGYRDSHQPLFVRPGESKSYLISLHPWAADEKLVGRDGEMSMLKFSLEAVISSKTVRRVLVTGADGIGKNRLLNSFNDYIEFMSQDMMVFFAECHEQHTLVPYAAVTEAFRIRAGVVADDDESAVRNKIYVMIETALSKGGPPSQSDRERLENIVNILIKLPGLAITEVEPDLAPEKMRERFDSALMDAMRLMTRWMPVLFVLYEVEYLDDASARLVRVAPKFMGDAPMLILGFGVDVGMQRGWDERIRMGPLSSSAVEALLRDLLKSPLPNGLNSFVMARSGGVPWLVVDTVRALAEDFRLYTDNGRWVLKDEIEEPKRVSMFEARREMVNALPRHLVAGLRAAAVVGDVFWVEALEYMGVQDPEACCAELTERELIRAVPYSRYPNTHGYAFRSLLFREIVYDQIQDDEELSRMHTRVADWIRARFVSDIREVAELARHVELAQDETWAALLFAQLGDACRDIGCIGMARECYQRALTNTVEVEDRDLLEERLDSLKSTRSG